MSKKNNNQITQVDYNDIKTPTTKDELVENLKKYYMTGDRFMFRIFGEQDFCEYDQIDTIINLLQNNSTLELSPAIKFNVHDVTTEETMSFIRDGSSFTNLYNDSERFKIFDVSNCKDTMMAFDTINASWWSTQNKFLREFFYKTLGEFGFYTRKEKQVA